MNEKSEILNEYVASFCGDLKERYAINYGSGQYNLKRGLRNADGTGVLVGFTKVGSVQGYMVEDGAPVPIPGKLYYRGYDVMDIVNAHAQDGTFGYEEVAYLLLMGKLPTHEQFRRFDTVLSHARILPDGFTEDMIIKAPSKNIMNKLARSVLALYSYDDNPDDTSIENLMRQSIELIGRFPIIVANAYAVKRHYFDGKSLYIHVPKEELSVSENFLRIVRKDKSYTREEALLLDIMLMLHAEHGGGNNSAFTCRVLSSSGTDTYSAIAGAVGSLKGPLHGGASKKVMDMFNDLKANVKDVNDDDEVAHYLGKILDGEVFDGAGKIYGLGHAVYTMSDPRAEALKKYAQKMAENTVRKRRYVFRTRLHDAGHTRGSSHSPLCHRPHCRLVLAQDRGSPHRRKDNPSRLQKRCEKAGLRSHGKKKITISERGIVSALFLDIRAAVN